jgi:beta-glucanase (GH16 family)
MSSLALLVAVAGILYAHSRAVAEAANNWTKVWSADFNGLAGRGVPAAQWSYQTGKGVFGNNSVETMTSLPQNVHLDGGGNLDITALLQNSMWTSGRIKSKQAFTPPRGGELKVVATIKQPSPAAGLGYWPAFWLLGQGAWPAHGEIDILEDVNTMSEHSGAFHCGNLTQHNSDGTLGPCHEYTGLSSHLLLCGKCQQGFHSYSVIVNLRNSNNGEIDWYLDGRQFFTVQENQVGSAVWNEAIGHGFWIIFDLAIGGSYPNNICKCWTPTGATTSGGTMSVSNVAVYRQG